MITEYQGKADGAGLRVGLAVASWNQTITDGLLDGALRACETLGVAETIVLRVPGSLEVPLAAKRLIDKGCDAVVGIGAVVKGDTDHYEIVVRESAAGLSAVSLETGRPVANAILALHDFTQALDRSGAGEANKGWEAVHAAVMTATAIADMSE